MNQATNGVDIFSDHRTPYPVSACVKCRGTRMLCGKPVCPILVKYYADSRVRDLTSKEELDGLSPPGIFIGRFGYPRVDIGPFVTPMSDGVELFDTPERWVGMKLEEITQMRFSLIRGKHSVRVDRDSDDRIYSLVQEISMARAAPATEVKFARKPSVTIALDDDIQPFGRSGRIEKIRADTGSFDRRIEKAYYDTDLRAGEAVYSLYRSNVLVSSIQRAFSAGVLGTGRNRKMVPTRWSITAVDDMIGRRLLSENRLNGTLWEYRVYSFDALDNRWIVLLLPTSWRYELIEAWYPNTTWNPTGRHISIMSSHEFYDGRRDYAEIGGCYYSARLAVNELLKKEGIQAGAVIMREAHPGYMMPIGVWNVREHVRATLRTRPARFETLNDALTFAQKHLEIPMERWMMNSTILRDAVQQRTLAQF